MNTYLTEEKILNYLENLTFSSAMTVNLLAILNSVVVASFNERELSTLPKGGIIMMLWYKFESDHTVINQILTLTQSLYKDSYFVVEMMDNHFIAKIQELLSNKNIDSDVYNQIKLIYENKKKGTYDLYIAKHGKNINKWGVLQYVDKIDDPSIGKLKAKALLKLYNKKQRTLTISKVIGNKNVRAGSLVPVILDLQDIKVANYMVVEKVTHSFENKRWTMDLVLSGGDFSG